MAAIRKKDTNKNKEYNQYMLLNLIEEVESLPIEPERNKQIERIEDKHQDQHYQQEQRQEDINEDEKHQNETN